MFTGKITAIIPGCIGRLLEGRLKGDNSNVLVLGPRQVGKSTLLSGLGPDLVIDLSSLSAFRQYAAHPEQLEAELLAAGPEIRTVFLDEVQRVPVLLDAVQYIHDSNPGRFRFDRLRQLRPPQGPRRCGVRLVKAAAFRAYYRLV